MAPIIIPMNETVPRMQNYNRIINRLKMVEILLIVSKEYDWEFEIFKLNFVGHLS